MKAMAYRGPRRVRITEKAEPSRHDQDLTSVPPLSQPAPNARPGDWLSSGHSPTFSRLYENRRCFCQ